MNAPPPGQTLVTALYDLERRECIGRRDTESYLRLGEALMRYPVPMVVYTDPELAGPIAAMRAKHGHDDITRVVARPFESLRLHTLWPTIEGFRGPVDADPRKDTPRCQILGWSKLDLLEEVIDDDPYGNDHAGWIDFGIAHVADMPERFPPPSRLVSVLQMRAVAPAELADRAAFEAAEHGRIAGGWIGGRHDALRELLARFRHALASALARGARPSEQILLSVVSGLHPELFEFHYGDYPSILVNRDAIRRDLDTVIANAAHCRSYGLWHDAHAICRRALDSVASGALEPDDERLARLLDESYIAAWYVGRRDLADRSRRDFGARASATAYATTHSARLAANFALMRDPVPATAAGPADVAGAVPLVSVLIPVHDGESTLERAVRSVLRQTCADLEVLIVDDASSDGSLALVRRLASEDARVRVIARHTCSGSPVVPRATALAAARGRYVALIDQDDEWLPDKLAAQLARFDTDDIAVVYSDATVVLDADPADPARPPERSTPVPRRRWLPEGDIVDALLGTDCVPALTAVARRDALVRAGAFARHDLVGVDDYDAWLRIALGGGRYAAIHEPLAIRHEHARNLGTIRAADCAASLVRMWRELARDFPALAHRMPVSREPGQPGSSV